MSSQTEWKLMGFVGASGAGKTSIAQTLVEHHGFHRLHMGQPIKDMLGAFGLSELELQGSPEIRSAPAQALAGRSPRFAMQTLGTEWGREMISKTIWADHLRRRLESLREEHTNWIVVDDLRFPEDFEAIKDAGGVIVRIIRPAAEGDPSWPEKLARKIAWLRNPLRKLGLNVDHSTEVHWRTAPATFEILNDGSLEATAAQLLAMCNSESV